MNPNKVLLIGLKPEVVDFSRWPELSVEKLNQQFEKIVEELAANGYQKSSCTRYFLPSPGGGDSMEGVKIASFPSTRALWTTAFFK